MFVTYSLDSRKTYSFNDISFEPSLLYCKHLIDLYLTTIQLPTNLPINLPQIPSKQYISLPSPFGEGAGVRLFFFLFLSFSLPIQFILLTFAAVKELAMTYQVNEVLQRIIRFFASFCTLSLVNPNNLLTHTHTMRT